MNKESFSPSILSSDFIDADWGRSACSPRTDQSIETTHSLLVLRLTLAQSKFITIVKGSTVIHSFMRKIDICGDQVDDS